MKEEHINMLGMALMWVVIISFTVSIFFVFSRLYNTVAGTNLKPKKIVYQVMDKEKLWR